MKINIERSPQWCPSEGSNWEPFDYENDALTARPQSRGEKVTTTKHYFLTYRSYVWTKSTGLNQVANL